VVPDTTGPGRGAYVCAVPACVERALKRLAQAFRQPARADEGLAWTVRAAQGPATGDAQ
jgi:predicted RNA-binding protein YlxR (DUF448 family)